jgi:hypothetical protein
MEENAATDKNHDSLPMKPEILDEQPELSDQPVSEPTKLIRIASMTRAMLEEVRQAPLDEEGRKRLGEIHQQSLVELREVLSPELAEEFDDIFPPFEAGSTPSESVIRVAQAQLIGWLEGLFHGIQATLFSQQMAARAQLAEMQQQQPRIAPGPEPDPATGLYL